MAKNKKIIRDFLYVDLDRLYSLYSQVFGGVANQMVESFTSQATSSESGKSHPLSGRTIEDQVAELSTRTEVRWLHDAMYSRLKEKLGSVIVANPELTLENYEPILSECFLLKVCGAAEIGDYQRLRTMLDKYNSLGEAIAYSYRIKPDSGGAGSISDKEIALIKDRNARTRAQELAKKQPDTKSLAKALGLYQQDELLKNLTVFLDYFGMDPYEIVISALAQPSIAFRGVLNREWLRVKPELLRSLYGTSLEGPVTMVGQITHLPRLNAVAPATDVESLPVRESSETRPSMRDAYQNMFKAGRALEHMFLESDSRVDVVVCPLAIYRERTIEMPEEPTGI